MAEHRCVLGTLEATWLIGSKTQTDPTVGVVLKISPWLISSQKKRRSNKSHVDETLLNVLHKGNLGRRMATAGSTSPKINGIKWAAACPVGTPGPPGTERRKIQSCVALFWTRARPFYCQHSLLQAASLMGFQFDLSLPSDWSNTNPKWLETVWRSCRWHKSDILISSLHFCFLQTCAYCILFCLAADAVVKIVSSRNARAVFKRPLKSKLMITFTKGFVVLAAVSHVEAVFIAVAGELVLLLGNPVHRIVALHQGKSEHFLGFLVLTPQLSLYSPRLYQGNTDPPVC